MSGAPRAFARVVVAAMERRGLGLRELCRRAEVDPSLLSKILAGKRAPPSDEGTLHRLACALEADPVELVVAAGLVPAAWSALTRDPELLRAVHRLASGAAAVGSFHEESRPRAAERPRPARPAAAPASFPAKPRGLSEELL